MSVKRDDDDDDDDDNDKRLGAGAPIKVDAKKLTGGFRARLYQIRRDIGWTQSDMARHLWGEATDKRGYQVAKNRDRISAYENGRSVPERTNLDRIATALGLTLEELAPDLMASAAQTQAPPAIQLRVVSGQPGMARLQVDVLTSFASGAKILEILQADEATRFGAGDGNGNGNGA